jgi:hypothetical protein
LVAGSWQLVAICQLALRNIQLDWNIK